MKGAVFCSSCVQKQTQRQTNACAAGYNTTRVVNATDGSTTCACGEGCKGTETYNFCGGTDNKDLYTVQRYVCPPNNYIGTPTLVQTCSSPTCTTLTPTYTSQGYSACYTPPTGSNNCSTGPVYRDTNRCSSTYNNYFIDINSTYYNVGGQPTAGACNTNPIWTNNGSFNCYGTCNSYYVQSNTNRCSSTFGTTRQGDLYQTNTTFCGGCCGLSTAQVQGAQQGSYHSCSNGTVTATPVYVNSNTCYTGPDQWLLNGVWQSPSPANAYPDTNPVFTYQEYSACYNPGTYPCTTGLVYRNTNACSPTYNNYFIEVSGNKVNVGGQPTAGACNTDPICTDSGSSYCLNGNRVINQVNTNTCSNGTCNPRVITPNDPTCSATVRIYGARTSGTSGVIYYGIDNAACPLGGTVSLLTGGSLNYTVSVPFGSTLYIKTYVPSSESACLHCAQQTTGSYCSSYTSCLSSYVINSSTDISVKAATSTSCTP